MRDPARIDPILDALREYWSAHPDMRLGQIVSNCTPDRFRSEGRMGHIWDPETRQDVLREIPGPRDPFYMEDDAFLEGLRKLPW